MPLFDRDISVEIQTQTKLIIIDKLRIDFECVKTDTNDANTCTISIYNLSESTISNIKDIDLNVTLNAGYKEYDGKEVVFKGNTNIIYTKYDHPDKITVIKIKDGEKELNESFSSLSYKEGIDLKTILKKTIKDLSLSLKTNIDKINFKNIKFNNSFSFSGQTKFAIDDLTKTVGLQWSIQNQQVKFYLEDEIDLTIVINLTSKSGIIGSPERLKIKRDKKVIKEGIDGWKIISLLQPKIEPGNTVSVESRDIPKGSFFKVINVTHKGSKYTDTFQTIIEAVKYE